ncbi:MAG TPA: hypothetical protein VFM14_11010 [Gemmatimonadales bacterium]|nr:hypothetical protein [Gemmatimonadales bacterium]
MVAASTAGWTGILRWNPAPPGDIQLAGAPTAVTRTLTGKDELLTIGIMLLLTMLVMAAVLASALVRHRPAPLVARTRDHRR